MRDAAADLEFEEAARLRDEIKRLEQLELAVADDPLARHPGEGGSDRSGRGANPSLGRKRGRGDRPKGGGWGQLRRDAKPATAPTSPASTR